MTTSCQPVLEHPDARIVLLEDYSCDERYQLLAREAHYVRTMECVNKYVPIKDASPEAAEKRLQAIIRRNEKLNAKRAVEHEEMLASLRSQGIRC